MKSKPLEELIIAVLLSDCNIDNTPNGRHISFIIDERKIPYLENYIRENNIFPHVEYDKNENTWMIKQSILLEKILREWTDFTEVIAVDPRYISENCLLLWILLFAEKTQKGVSIQTNLPANIRKDIPYYFEDLFKVRLFEKGNSFYIKTYYTLLYRANQIKRPAMDHLELNYLLHDHEVKKYKAKILSNR